MGNGVSSSVRTRVMQEQAPKIRAQLRSRGLDEEFSVRVVGALLSALTADGRIAVVDDDLGPSDAQPFEPKSEMTVHTDGQLSLPGFQIAGSQTAGRGGVAGLSFGLRQGGEGSVVVGASAFFPDDARELLVWRLGGFSAAGPHGPMPQLPASAAPQFVPISLRVPEQQLSAEQRELLRSTHGRPPYLLGFQVNDQSPRWTEIASVFSEQGSNPPGGVDALRALVLDYDRANAAESPGPLERYLRQVTGRRRQRGDPFELGEATLASIPTVLT